MFLYIREEYEARWAWHFLQEVSGEPLPASPTAMKFMNPIFYAAPLPR